ncbi:uncharacterized protein [Palaemon carinicauda]|uniref:uncharacterized protein n=1 Tax=Palaemon carinicauda TaxID=392227 RepID=UPI0035B59F8D
MILKRGKRSNVEQGLTVEQLRVAEVAILRYIQRRHYASEIKALSEGRGVGKSSTLGSLDPVLDSDVVIRVGGRLKRARVSEDFQSPYLVPMIIRLPSSLPMISTILHIVELNGSLVRFVKTRGGIPKSVWSDNGTNFAGGQAQILSIFKDLNQRVLHEYGLDVNLEWHFNPLAASHMGGVWERLIRTLRKVLVGFMGTEGRLSDEGLETLFSKVEFVVKRRPITKVSDDALDISPLTPNHLLMLSENIALPPGVFSECAMYRCRWRQVQHLANTFWRCWLKEYLPQLQVRAKWHKRKANLEEGDLVLVFGENTPRGFWPMVVVEEVFQGDDGRVRSAKIRTRCSSFT